MRSQRNLKSHILRRNPYATTGEGDPYIERIAQFAIDLEKTYLKWLYEMLDFLEEQKMQESK